MVKIYIEPKNLWSFFFDHVVMMEHSSLIVAENKETGYAVYMTGKEVGSDLLRPYIMAVREGVDKAEEGEVAISPADCEDVAKRIYRTYLFPLVIVEKKTEALVPVTKTAQSVPAHESLTTAKKEVVAEDINEEDFHQMLEDEIYVREDELRLAMADFLNTVLQEEDCEGKYGSELIDNLLAFLLPFLAEEYGMSIYRPVMIADEDGCAIYTEYPYDEEIDEYPLEKK